VDEVSVAGVDGTADGRKEARSIKSVITTTALATVRRVTIVQRTSCGKALHRWRLAPANNASVNPARPARPSRLHAALLSYPGRGAAAARMARWRQITTISISRARNPIEERVGLLTITLHIF